jgi:light-regulated signal transduction histidine kinase (bacteriophytochrome)
VLISRRMAEHFDDDTREFMGFVLDGASRMENLVNDLLEFSHTGRSTELPTSIDFNAVFLIISGYVREALNDCDGVIEWPEKFPEIIGNESEIVRLFNNLISNAIKYRSPDRKLKITVSVVAQGGGWLFSVADNGIGIAPEYFERIFRVFQRLHAPGASGGGTGIGLAICKKVIEEYGGKIWVEAKPDFGSTFFFTIPMKQ